MPILEAESSKSEQFIALQILWLGIDFGHMCIWFEFQSV